MRKLLFQLLLLLAIIYPIQAKIEDHVPLLTIAVICLAKACQEVAQEQKIKNKLKQEELKKHCTAHDPADLQKTKELIEIIKFMGSNHYLLEICAKNPTLQQQCNTIFSTNTQTYTQASELLKHKLKQLQDNNFVQEDLAILREFKAKGYHDGTRIAHAVLRTGSVPTDALSHLSNSQRQELRKLTTQLT